MRLLLALLVGTTLGAAGAPATELDDIRALADSGRAERALHRLEQLLVGQPDHLEGQLLRGVLLVELDRTDEAERAFALLRRQHPDRPEPINNLAVLQAASGRRASALAALEEIVASYPSYQTAAANLEQVRLGVSGSEFDPLSPDSSRAQLFLTAELGSYPRVGPPPARREPTAVEPPPVTPPPPPIREPAAALPGPTEPSAAPPAAAIAEPPPTPPERPAGESPAPLDGLRAELVEVVTAWAEAWSRQRVREYLDFYAPDFRPTGYPSRAAWEEVRRQRVAAPAFIEVGVDLESLTLRREGPDTASVTFVQHYRSDRFGDTVEKMLELVRRDRGWRIRGETSR